MRQILIIILCGFFYFIQCSLPLDDCGCSGPIEYESFLASISIEGKNDQIIMSYCSSSGAVNANMYWLGEKPLFILHQDGLTIYNLMGEMIKKINEPTYISGMDISPDGSYAVLACNSELFLLNTVSFEMRTITDSPDMMERYPRFSQDGQKIVYTTMTGKDPLALKLYDLAADSSYALLRDNENMHFLPFATPCFGRNDEIIYYIHNFSDTSNYAGTSQLFSLNLKSGQTELIDENALWFAYMKYAPVGDRLVYLTSEPFCGIRVYDAANKTFFELGDKIQNECHAIGPNQILNINPQGTIVVAGTDYCSDTNLYSINVENAEYFRICLGTSPTLSHDGKTILYVKTQPRDE